MIFSLFDYLTSCGKYKDRAESPEATEEVKGKAMILLARVTSLLFDLMIVKAILSSGFRTTQANGKTKGAAKKSKHQTGQALDIQGNAVSSLLMNQQDLLVKHDLYMEHPECTVQEIMTEEVKTALNGSKVKVKKTIKVHWTHLQSVPPGSKKRVFRCGICKACKK